VVEDTESIQESFDVSNKDYSEAKKEGPVQQVGLLRRGMTQLQIKEKVSSHLSSNSHKSKLDA
jgi:hypothetical protein